MELIAGIVCGFLSGLGIGGGSLLIIWLTAVLQMAQTEARAINLLYFLPTAAASLFFHSKNRFVDWKSSAWMIPGGILAALFGLWLSRRIPTEMLRTCFGVFLLFIGISELCKKSPSSET